MNQPSTRSRHRKGWLLLELSLAMMLLLFMVYTFMEVSVRMHHSLELNRQRAIALECLQNVADELFLAGPDAWNSERLAAWPLPGWAAEWLPAGQLILQREAAPDAEGVTITIRWQQGATREVHTTVYQPLSATEGEDS